MQTDLTKMDGGEFLAIVDTLFDYLGQKIDGNSAGGWAVEAIQEELRRRVLEQSRIVESQPQSQVQIRVERVELELSRSARPPFSKIPAWEITLGNGSCSSGMRYYSSKEAEAFLLGVQQFATLFGLPIEKFPEVPVGRND